MSDFSDRPLVAGALTGIRTFAIDKLGRLTGVHQKTVWRPGENVAECRKSSAGGVTITFGGGAGGGIFGGSGWMSPPPFRYVMGPSGDIRVFHDDPTPVEKPPVSLVKKPRHRVGQLNCTCGFYAYFDDGSNPYHQKGFVRGIVEGYGVTTVGDRGFRCEKAEIKALIVPAKKLADPRYARVVDNYGLRVFGSKRDALEAFPLTPPAVPTPETDPEFWTRAVSS